MANHPIFQRILTPILLLLGIVLYALGMPPVSFGPAMLLGIAILGYAATRSRFVTLWGFGIALHLGLYAWLTSVTYAGLIALAAIMGALWAIPLHLWKRWGNPVGVASVWVLLELIRSQLGWGWLPTAASAISMPAVLGWASIGGEFLLGGIIVSWGLFLAAALRHPRSHQRWIRVILCTAILFAGGPLANSLSQTRQNDDIPPLKIGVVQPNTRMDLDKSTEEMIDEFARLTDLTTPLKGNVDLIIWPEQMTPWPINTDARMRNWVSTGADFLQADIITGALWEELSDENDSSYYNTVVQIRKGIGLLPQFYAKRRLVPFGEYVPFADLKWMHSFTPVVDSFTAGEPEGKLLLVQKAWRLWPMICYEDTFWQLSLGASDQADAMLVLTNDAWFGKMGAHSQHFAHSILRAVEQGIPLLRVANNGISGLIAPDGSTQIMRDETGQTDSAMTRIVELKPYRRYTLYAHTPIWLWPTVVWAACIILISRSVSKEFR